MLTKSLFRLKSVLIRRAVLVGVGMLVALTSSSSSCQSDDAVIRRIAWLIQPDCVHESEFGKLADAIRSSDCTINSIGDPYSRISLLRCEPEQKKSETCQLLGASGRWSTLPDPTLSECRRGIFFGESRPGEAARQSWLEPHQVSSETEASIGVLPILRSEQLPTDVVSWIDKDQVAVIGFDWNADLVIEEVECFRFSRRGETMIRQIDGRLFILQISTGSSDASPWMLDWISLGRSSDSLPSESFAAAVAELASSHEIELFRCSGGAADLAATCLSAVQEDCSLLLVDLDVISMHATEAARLLATLARQLDCAIITNRRTIVSPEYDVDPSLVGLPDIAEVSLVDTPRSKQTTGTSDRRTLLATVLDAINTAGQTLNADRRQRPIDRFDLPSALRLPNDWVDVSFGNVSGIQSLQAVLYDRNGNRVGEVRDRSNQIWFDRLPPALIRQARGGFIVADPQGTPRIDQQVRWTISDTPFQRAERSLLGDVSVRLPRTETDSNAFADISPEFRSGSGTKANAGLKEVYVCFQPQHVRTNEVDKKLLATAMPLVDRPGVRSWWYRLDDSVSEGQVWHFLLDELNGRDYGSVNDFSFRLFSRRGTVSKLYRIGEAASSEAETWLLLQCPSFKHPSIAPPKLMRLARTQVSDPSLTWNLSSGRWHALLRGVDERAAGFLASINASPENNAAVGWTWISNAVKRPEVAAWKQLYLEDPLLRWRQSVLETETDPVHSSSASEALPQEFQRIRQRLIMLDTLATRKQHLEKIIAECDHVLHQCEQRIGPLPRHADPKYRIHQETMGEGQGRSASHSRKVSGGDAWWYAWAVDAAYRKVRAVGYRELPEVTAIKPIADPLQQSQDYQDAFALLNGLVDGRDPDFVLPWVRWLRRNNQPAEAYDVLRRYGYCGPASSWFLKKQRDLWTEANAEPLSRLGHARWFVRENGLPVPMEAF
ncbi:MAG: hypothetical protein AAGJ83_00725 [Planctomycetota bacterium]